MQLAPCRAYQRDLTTICPLDERVMGSGKTVCNTVQSLGERKEVERGMVMLMATKMVLVECRSNTWDGEKDALLQVMLSGFVAIGIGRLTQAGLYSFQQALAIAPPGDRTRGKRYVMERHNAENESEGTKDPIGLGAKGSNIRAECLS